MSTRPARGVSWTGRQNERPSAKVAILSFLALFFCSIPAFAQRVVLIRQPSDPPLVVETIHRLAGELRLHDFHVLEVEVPDGAPLDPDELARIAEEADAVASIALVAKTGRTTADIWLSDRVTGKTSVRTLETRNASEGPSILAIRAVDLLRLSLRELSSDAPLPPEVVGAHPERAPEHVRDWAEPTPDARPYEVRTELALVAPVQAFQPGFGLGVALGRRLFGPLSLRVLFAGPSQGARIHGEGGSARLEQIVGLLELGVGFSPLERVRLEATAGLGVHRLQVVGEADLPRVAASGELLSFAGGLGAGAEIALTEGVALGISLRGLGITPSPRVVFADESRLLGVLVLLASGGLRVSF